MCIYVYICIYIYIFFCRQLQVFVSFVLVLSAVSWMCLNEFKMRLSMILFNVFHTAVIDFDHVFKIFLDCGLSESACLLGQGVRFWY